jgi:hypothetical protein
VKLRGVHTFAKQSRYSVSHHAGRCSGLGVCASKPMLPIRGASGRCSMA